MTWAKLAETDKYLDNTYVIMLYILNKIRMRLLWVCISGGIAVIVMSWISISPGLPVVQLMMIWNILDVRKYI